MQNKILKKEQKSLHKIYLRNFRFQKINHYFGKFGESDSEINFNIESKIYFTICEKLPLLEKFLLDAKNPKLPTKPPKKQIIIAKIKHKYFLRLEKIIFKSWVKQENKQKGV